MSLTPLGQVAHTAIDHAKLRLKHLPDRFQDGNLTLFHHLYQRRWTPKTRRARLSLTCLNLIEYLRRS